MPRAIRTRPTKRIDRLAAAGIRAKAYEDQATLPARARAEQVTRKWSAGMARHFREKFGDQLRSLREEAGLSLHALALKAGIDHSQLVRLESGERSCQIETAVRIAGALGVNLGILSEVANGCSDQA
jgi:ribosome-binding protein aMBF1 (putative translation factor)